MYFYFSFGLFIHSHLHHTLHLMLSFISFSTTSSVNLFKFKSITFLKSQANSKLVVLILHFYHFWCVYIIGHIYFTSFMLKFVSHMFRLKKSRGKLLYKHLHWNSFLYLIHKSNKTAPLFYIFNTTVNNFCICNQLITYIDIMVNRYFGKSLKTQI